MAAAGAPLCLGVDDPLVWHEGSGTSDRRRLHADERGSIVAISDGTGAVTSIDRYDEYGVPSATKAGRFGYTGQYWLGQSYVSDGLWHYKNRAYSPALGRFMKTDPIGYDDAPNLYAYVGGDPVNFVNPTGNITVTAPFIFNPTGRNSILPGPTIILPPSRGESRDVGMPLPHSRQETSETKMRSSLPPTVEVCAKPTDPFSRLSRSSNWSAVMRFAVCQISMEQSGSTATQSPGAPCLAAYFWTRKPGKLV